MNGTASPPVHLSYPCSAFVGEVVDAKKSVEEPLLVHSVNVPASGPQNNVHLLRTELDEKVAKMRLPALGTVLTASGEKDRGNEKILFRRARVRDDSASAGRLRKETFDGRSPRMS